jgi:hypothetical protein
MTVKPPTPASAATWLSRSVGSVMLLTQSAGHIFGVSTDLTLIAIGLFLLAGKEGLQVLGLAAGRIGSALSDGDQQQ